MSAFDAMSWSGGTAGHTVKGKGSLCHEGQSCLLLMAEIKLPEVRFPVSTFVHGVKAVEKTSVASVYVPPPAVCLSLQVSGSSRDSGRL